MYDNYGPDGSRDPFSGIWSRTLRVKITGRDGLEKLDVRIPVSSYCPSLDSTANMVHIQICQMFWKDHIHAHSCIMLHNHNDGIISVI